MAIFSNRYICYIFGILAFYCDFNPLAASDARLIDFIEKLEALEGKSYPLLHPKNPLQPYSGRPFEAGLDAQERRKLHQMQENGECGPDLEALIEKGVLQLYPFLKPAFEARLTGYPAKWLLVFSNVPAQARCFYYLSWRQRKLHESAASFDPIDFDGGQLFALTHRPPGDRGVIWDRLSNQMYGLGRLAFCMDYPPSIADLMVVANKPGGLRLTEQEALYIAARARHHNLLEDVDIQRAISRIKSAPTYPGYKISLLQQARYTKILAMPHVTGYWQPACHVSLSIDLEK